MNNLAHKFWLKHPSTYTAFAIWGATGFMAQPTLASGVVHLILVPPMLFLNNWLSRREGQNI